MTVMSLQELLMGHVLVNQDDVIQYEVHQHWLSHHMPFPPQPDDIEQWSIPPTLSMWVKAQTGLGTAVVETQRGFQGHEDFRPRDHSGGCGVECRPLDHHCCRSH